MNTTRLSALAGISLAGILAVSMIATPAFAAGNSVTRDPKGDTTESAPSSSFDIKSFGVNNDGNPYVSVYGKAGRTVPLGDVPLIYAFVLFTDDGVYAIASHVGFADSDEGNGSTDWHAHKVTIDENHCITSIDDEGTAELQGNKYILEGTDATTISAAHAVQLEITGTSGLGVCATGVFDIAE